MDTLRRIHRVGLSVFLSALLNTASQNVYNFVIGVWYSVASLGVYSQADKWSKMGSASISQILTSTFVPLLSKVQDSRQDFHRYVDRAGRFTAFILLPSMTLLAILAAPIFHLLFGNKWDAAIPLFSMLAVRGIFVVLISLYSNYLLALGRARKLFMSEAVKDGLILLAIAATVGFADIDLLVLGQTAASVLTWIVLLPLTARGIGMTAGRLVCHLLPFLAATLAAILAALGAGWLLMEGLGHPEMSVALASRLGWNTLLMATETAAFAAVYLLVLQALRTPEFPESAAYLFGRFRRKP